MGTNAFACHPPRNAAACAQNGRSIRLAAACAAFLGLQLIASVAFAQQDWPTLVVRGGALIVDLSSDVRIDSSVGTINTSIDLEDILGLDSRTTTYFVDGTWRLSRRNQIQVDYEKINRDIAHDILNQTITFHDTTFSANAAVDTFFDSSYLSVFYGFAFVANPRLEAGVSIGATLLRLHTGIGLSASTSGSSSVSRDLSEDVKWDVPVPLPGVFVNIRPHPRVTISGSTRVLKVTINDISASMVEAKGGADVHLVGPLGVGGAYYYNRLSADRENSSTNGHITYSFSGPQVYAVLSF